MLQTNKNKSRKTVLAHWLNNTINFFFVTYGNRIIGAVIDIKLLKSKFLRFKFEYAKKHHKLPFISFSLKMKDIEIISAEYYSFILKDTEPDDFFRFMVASKTMVVKDRAELS